MSEITLLIEAADRGDPQAVNALLPLVYEELRKLAAARLAQESSGQTLQPTALVHEAYLRLLGDSSGETPRFANQRHFFAAAAESMRRILIERARAKATLKRGGDGQRVDLDLNEFQFPTEERSEDLLALDDALVELERHDSQAAELVKLRFYAGLSHQQAAESMGLSRRAADRVWALARAWLFRQIKRTEP